MAVDATRRTEKRGGDVGQPIVALVGRPNVGKSTLFNRLAGHRLAIVEDEPGTTRDRQYAPAEWTQQPFVLVDTGGLDVAASENAARESDHVPLGSSRVTMCGKSASRPRWRLHEADLVVFLVDARDGSHVCRPRGRRGSSTFVTTSDCCGQQGGQRSAPPGVGRSSMSSVWETRTRFPRCTARARVTCWTRSLLIYLRWSRTGHRWREDRHRGTTECGEVVAAQRIC